MDEKMVIAVNPESADIFSDFAQQHPEFMEPKDTQKLLIGSEQLVEFLIAVVPAMITAFATYLAARIAAAGKSIRIKVGDYEIELTNTDLTPDAIIELLSKLEKKKA